MSYGERPPSLEAFIEILSEAQMHVYLAQSIRTAVMRHADYCEELRLLHECNTACWLIMRAIGRDTIKEKLRREMTICEQFWKQAQEALKAEEGNEQCQFK